MIFVLLEPEYLNFDNYYWLSNFRHFAIVACFTITNILVTPMNLEDRYSVGAELFHADRQTDGAKDRRADMTKLIVAFRNFANAPENCA